MKAEKVYVNIELINAESSNYTELKYDEVKDIPVLHTQSRNPADNSWEVSVDRWSIMSSAIPILFFKDNAYFVTISSPAVPNPAPTAVVYVPAFEAPFSLPPYNRAVFDYTTMIEFINTALSTAFVTAGGNANEAPFLKYYPTTRLINLILPKNPIIGENWYSQAFPTGWKIYMNYSLYNFFVSLPAVYLKINPPNPPINNQLDYIIVCDSLRGTNEYAAGALFPSITYPTLVIQEEYEVLTRFQDIQKVVFTTSKIPVFCENTPTIAQSGKARFLNTLTDFELDISFFDKSTLTFNGGSNPRWSTLQQDVEVRSIDVQGYWQSKDGTLYPIFLAPKSDSFTMKLAFRRRWKPVRTANRE